MLRETAYSLRRDVVDNDAFPERLASGNEPCVVLALGLIELVVLQGLEVQRGREVERMIHDGAMFRLRRRADEPALEIRNRG